MIAKNDAISAPTAYMPQFHWATAFLDSHMTLCSYLKKMIIIEYEAY